jgi:hypothetical protein
VRAYGLALVFAACGMARPMREPILPELAAPSPTWNTRIVDLRTTLGRSAIRLEVRGATEVLRGTACTDSLDRRLQTGCVRCELAGETEALDSAVLESVKAAFDRYPGDVLEATHIDKVALCRSLSYEDFPDSRVIGTVDLRERRLFVSVAPFLGTEYDASGDVTTEDIVHHELFHLFEFERMGGVFADDPEWRLQNPLGFVYDATGEQAPRRPGFINPYASTNELEDRASVFQYLMARPDDLCKVASTDDVLRAKTRLVWARIAAITADSFLRERARCALTLLAPTGSAGSGR